MVRGKDYSPRIDIEECASNPKLSYLVTFAPPITSSHSAVHAVPLCGMMPVSPAGIRGRLPRRLGTQAGTMQIGPLN